MGAGSHAAEHFDFAACSKMFERACVIKRKKATVSCSRSFLLSRSLINATVSCSRSFLLSTSLKKCNSLVFPRFLLSRRFRKCNSLVFPLVLCCLEASKMYRSRVPACFCCLEASKHATVSCSRSFLLSRSLQKYNSLVFPLVFAV